MTTSSVRWCCATPPQTMTDPHLQINPALEYRPRRNAHSFDDKRESDHHPWWEELRLISEEHFLLVLSGSASVVGAHRQSCCRWCLVRTCLTTGLQALNPVSLSLLWTVWALMEGLCIPGVTRAVVVSILYLSRRCDVRMYRSCAGVVICGLSVQWGFITLATYVVLMPPCSMPKARSCIWAGTLGIFLLVYFRVSRIAYRL
jgi:hypothetical protein